MAFGLVFPNTFKRLYYEELLTYLRTVNQYIEHHKYNHNLCHFLYKYLHLDRDLDGKQLAQHSQLSLRKTEEYLNFRHCSKFKDILSFVSKVIFRKIFLHH